MSRDVRGFLHVCCLGGYREVTWEIMHAILESGLYDRSVAIELGVLGAEADQRVVETLIRPFERFRIAFRSSDLGEYEFPTLGLLQEACQTWDGPVYYVHTKGVSHSSDNSYSRYWRQLMLDEVVTNHERCLTALEGADTVGTCWRNCDYSGNFWWARPSHIRRLPDIRELQRLPRHVHEDPKWNKRLQCENWLLMTPGWFSYVGHSGNLNLYRQLLWTTSVADVVNELLVAGAGRHFAELSMDGPNPSEEDFLAADPPDGGYHVILLDARHQPKHCLDVIERCLPKLSADGALVIHHSNPPTAWHQRPAEEFEPGTEWTGQVWRAVVEFRIRHPHCEVFTVDTDWGCSVIRPSRPARHQPGATAVNTLDWSAFVRDRNTLLNLVNVTWFRRYLYADPYLNGTATLAGTTELANVMISVNGLDSYLHIGAAEVSLTQIIAPIRQSIAPHAEATYQMTSDEFFAGDLGLDRYDLIVLDGLHNPDQSRRDLNNALVRLSDRGWILTHHANPTDTPGWQTLTDFGNQHPELDLCAFDLDRRCALIHRHATNPTPQPPPELPDTEERDTRTLAPQPYARDRDLLLAEIERNPNDARSVFHLAQSYFDQGDFLNAHKWYTRRAEMWEPWWLGMDEHLDEEAYFAMYRVAESLSNLGAPWPQIHAAYLRAWEFRPTRTEPLYALARHYREERRYQLGHFFAKRAAQIPLPEHDILSVGADIYSWRATDEQAVCASWTNKHTEAFTLNRRLLTRCDIGDDDRQRIAGNRDVSVPTMIDAATPYPDAIVQHLIARPGEPDLVVSLVAGADRGTTEQMLNSFLNCCLDVTRVGRFLVADTGLSAQDRAILHERYRFLEFTEPRPAQLAHIRAQIHARFWLHLGQGWRFFAPENFITRLTAVLNTEPQVFQVGINLTDAATLTGASAAEDTVRRAPDTGRYILTDAPASGPAMLDTTHLDRIGGLNAAHPDPLAELGPRAGAAGLRTASLDEVLCITAT